MFATVYSCLLTYVYPCLLVFTYIYSCLHILAMFARATYVYNCDVAGENRPTDTYFIIEFDLTKVVIGIFQENFL